jgi:NAD(P)-dependent dehydrogenase (short-subunit alcohol dehydrogenase family)
MKITAAPPELLASDTAVLAGGAQGNGAGIPGTLAACGAAVAVPDLNGAGAEHVAWQIVQSGGAAGFAPGVTDRTACVDFVAAAELRLAPLSIRVNNAGIARRMPPRTHEFARNLDLQFAVNVAWRDRSFARRLVNSGQHRKPVAFGGVRSEHTGRRPVRRRQWRLVPAAWMRWCCATARMCGCSTRRNFLRAALQQWDGKSNLLSSKFLSARAGGHLGPDGDCRAARRVRRPRCRGG